jgi:Protein of unknown function (DUF4012)
MTSPSRRRAIALGIGAGLVVVLVALVVLALPLLKARSEAKSAMASLQDANAALQAHQFGQARTSIDAAQSQVRSAEDHSDGFGGDVWAHVPVFGGAVQDARHLVSALDQATAVGDLGLRTYLHAAGPHASLIEHNQVDMASLRRLVALTSRIGPHLDQADSDLAAVQADTPFVGSKIDSLRTSADDQLSSVRSSYDRYEPLLHQLPSILGAEGRRSYLLAILNPAEQRYSGGATLSMSTLRVADGRIGFGPSYTVADIDRVQPFLHWQKVRGNVFHRSDPTRLTAATFSPWWQVSGEELLRAWGAQTSQRPNGLIVIDLQGLAGLFSITGPVQVAGYGELNAGNLVHTLAGSYDTFQDQTQRHDLNEAIVPAFRSRLLTGGKFLEKGQSLMASAQGRHFATYFRDPSTQQAAQVAGMAGNLSDSTHDYVGVFSQNLNGSKADYWQHRTVASTVRLRKDGSAVDHVTVTTSNPAPAFTQPITDPKSGYLTRWLGTLVGVFLPQGTDLRHVTVDGKPRENLHMRVPKVAGVYNRPVLRQFQMMAPDSTHRLQASYRVPSAAVVSSTGDLTYELALDPQDLVNPQTNQVSLHIPDGYHFGALPAGWTQKDDHVAVLAAAPLTASVSYSVPVLAD